MFAQTFKLVVYRMGNCLCRRRRSTCCSTNCLFRCLCRCCMHSTDEYKPLLAKEKSIYYDTYETNNIDESDHKQRLITGNNVEFNDYDDVSGMNDYLLLVFGYVRHIQLNLLPNTAFYIIPQSIIDMICNYYQKTTYSIYNVKCYYTKREPKMTTKIHNIAPNVKSLYVHDKSIFIMSENNHIYAMGINMGTLGIKSDNKISIKELTTNEFYQKHKFRVVGSSSVFCQHSFVLTMNNNLYGFGYNAKHNRLGSKPSFKNSHVNAKDEVFWPTLINTMNIKNKIIDIKIGYEHTLFLTVNGKVYGCGNNESGQLGLQQNNANTIILIDSLVNDIIIAIRCGSRFSIVLNDNDQIKGFGSDSNGQLGRGKASKKTLPEHKKPEIIKINDNELRVEQIECGEEHVCCLDKYNNIYCWGKNDRGQCGTDTKLYGGFTAQSGFSYLLFYSSAIASPTKIKLNHQKISRIACGNEYTVLMDDEMNLYSFGSNSRIYSSLFDNDYLEEHARIHCAKYNDFMHLINNKKIVDIKCGGHDSMYICVSNQDSVM
eukprot:401106_1